MEKAFSHAEQAPKAGDSFVTVEYVLLGMVAQKTDPAGKALEAGGVTLGGFQSAIENMRQGRQAHSSSAEDTYDA